MSAQPWTSADGRVALYVGDSREVLRGIADASVDAVVCDPPYELGFMGKKWDASGIAYDVDLWREVSRVMKPGAHLLAFGGARTYHRMTCAIEDAGFEIRDCIAWIYGSGFPKSLDVSKAIDKAAGAEREVVGVEPTPFKIKNNHAFDQSRQAWVDAEGYRTKRITAPATDAARQWQGWGTALKPAHEPIVVARKPLEGTVAANVITHGTGGINVDACRVGTSKRVPGSPKRAGASEHTVSLPGYAGGTGHDKNIGRWPANVALDAEAAQGMGEPSRYFYTAKASTHEREQGLAHRAKRKVSDGREAAADNPRLRGESMRGNTHPTVKPIDLMRWLCRLVTPPNGLILDPFAGSGSTLIAAHADGFRALGIELDEEHASIARDRLGGHASLFVGLR